MRNFQEWRIIGKHKQIIALLLCISLCLGFFPCEATAKNSTVLSSEERCPDCDNLLEKHLSSDGNCGYYVCTYCSYEESFGKHRFDLVDSREPTCGDSGYESYLCSACGFIKEDELEPTGDHDYVLTDSYDPPCGDGWYEYTCSVCGESYTDNFYIDDHDYVLTDSYDPPCGDGWYEYTCSRCGETYIDRVYNDDHDYVLTDSYDPPCGDGWYEYTCSRCGDSYTEYFTNEHDFVFVKAVPPTCGEYGYDMYVCSICGEREDVETDEPTENHTFIQIGKSFDLNTRKERGKFQCSVCKTTIWSAEGVEPDGSMFIVLDWGTTPEDLDSHLYGPNFHVWFEEMKAEDEDKRVIADLDRDDKDSFGPELTSIYGPISAGKYTFQVVDFSNEGNAASLALSQSEATVSVYMDNRLRVRYQIPKDFIGDTWDVFTYDAETDLFSTPEQHLLRFERSLSDGQSCVETSYDFDFSYFSGDSGSYNHDLARASLAMALSAYNEVVDAKTILPAEGLERFCKDEHTIKQSPAVNIYGFMEACGFDTITVNRDYLISTEYGDNDTEYYDGNNIGICMGKKELDDGTTLLAVALRGGGYGDEWIGNFKVYNPLNDPYHQGFELASEMVCAAVKNYVSTNSIKGNVKLWISGYSRAAAVSNLTAAWFCRNGLTGCTLKPGDIYAYTFETPQGTKQKDADRDIYNGIWNIVNPIDYVPFVAMNGWGYGRFGHTVTLPCASVNYSLYQRYAADALSLYNEYREEKHVQLPHIAAQNYLLKGFIGGLAALTGGDNTDAAYTAQSELQYFFMHNSLSPQATAAVIAVLALFKSNLLSDEIMWKVAASYVLFKDYVDLIPAHYPELCLAWMNAIPASALREDGKSIVTRTNCPVNLEVYTEDGVLQLRILNDEIFMEDGAFVEAVIDDAGQKVIVAPEDVPIEIRILPYEDESFNFSVEEVSASDGKAERVVNYYDVPAKQGESFEAVLSEGDCRLSQENGSEIEPDETLSGSEIEYYTVSLLAEGPGEVFGAARITQGGFVELKAEPSENSRFLGWYEGETLVTNEAVYRFRPERDMTLTGRFEEESVSLSGDVNRDGKVNGKDAILLAQHLAGWGVDLDKTAADVNKDAKVNGKDAIMLAQYLAGWDVVLQ